MSSNVIAYYPSFLDGYIWDFVGEHVITSCSNVGDSTTCAQGFKFNIWAGAQIRIGSSWTAIGGVNKAFADYPQKTRVSESFTIYCGPDDVGDSFTFRTRAKGGINHNGTWAFSPWAFSNPRTATCTRSGGPASISSLPVGSAQAEVTTTPTFWNVTLVSGGP